MTWRVVCTAEGHNILVHVEAKTKREAHKGAREKVERELRIRDPRVFSAERVEA